MKELADRKYLQNSQKSLSPEDMHREYRIAPRMEDILRQNAAKIKMSKLNNTNLRQTVLLIFNIYIYIY